MLRVNSDFPGVETAFLSGLATFLLKKLKRSKKCDFCDAECWRKWTFEKQSHFEKVDLAVVSVTKTRYISGFEDSRRPIPGERR